MSESCDIACLTTHIPHARALLLVRIYEYNIRTGPAYRAKDGAVPRRRDMMLYT